MKWIVNKCLCDIENLKIDILRSRSRYYVEQNKYHFGVEYLQIDVLRPKT
jgi:hypothetical protein